MSRWYRAYEGTVTDAKLAEAALIAECSRSVAIAAWHCILESAAASNEGGDFDASPRRVSVILCEPPAKIEALFEAFWELKLIDGDGVTSWKKRQYESDSSTERSRKCRDRKRNGDATLQQQGATPPYTEAETEEPPQSPAKRGKNGRSLIPSDWQPPSIPDLPPRAKALAELWTEASYATEAEAFACYWRSERKMKGDWNDTWANRVVARHSAIMRDQKFGNAAPQAKPATVERSADWHLEQAKWCDEHAKPYDAADHRRKALSIGQLAREIVK